MATTSGHRNDESGSRPTSAKSSRVKARPAGVSDRSASQTSAAWSLSAHARLGHAGLGDPPPSLDERPVEPDEADGQVGEAGRPHSLRLLIGKGAVGRPGARDSLEPWTGGAHGTQAVCDLTSRGSER